MRTYDTNSAEVMRAVGATAEFLPFNEAIAKLKDGSLNAILTSSDGGAGRKLWDYLRYFTPISYAIPTLSGVRAARRVQRAAEGRAGLQVTTAAAETEKSQFEPAREPHRRELCAHALERRRHRRDRAGSGDRGA